MIYNVYVQHYSKKKNKHLNTNYNTDLSEIGNILHCGLASVQKLIVYVVKYDDGCTKTRPECTFFGYLRKGLLQLDI